MADGGLRVLFAELGFEYDEARFRQADALIRALAVALRSIVPASAAAEGASESAGAAAEKASKKAAAAAQEEAKAVDLVAQARERAAAKRAAYEAEAEFRASDEGRAHTEWEDQIAAEKKAALDAIAAKKKAEADAEAEAKAHRDAEIAHENRLQALRDHKREQDAKLTQSIFEKANKESWTRASEAQKRSHGQRLLDLAEEAEKEREAHAAKKAFDASPIGKAQAEWKRLKEAEEEAQKPVKGLGDLLAKLHKQTAEHIGKKLPDGLKRLMQGVGVAEHDFAAMGEIALGASGAVVGGLVMGARAAFQFADAFAQATEQVRDTARGLEVTTSELHAFRYAAEASGVGAGRMDAALGALHTRLEAIYMRRGSDWSFRRLGIEVRDATGAMRPATEVMVQVAQALDRIPDPVRRAREAQRLLGSDARRLLDVLHTGEGGLAGYLRRVQELGGGILPEAAEASRRYTQAQGELRIATDSLRSVIATALLPRLAELVTKGAEALGWFSRMARGSRVVQVGLAALVAVGVAAAGSLLASWAAAAAPFVLAAAAIALTVLALDDLWNFLEGHNSLIGTFLGKIEELVDSMIGVGQTAHYVRQLKGAWEEFIGFIEAHQETIDKVLQVLGSPAAMGRNVGRSLRELMGLDNAPERASGAEGGDGEGGAASAAEHAPGWRPQRETARRGTPTVEQPGMASAVATPDVTQVGLDGRVIVAESPATRTVPAPPSAGGRGGVQHVHHHAAARYQFNLSGADPRALAQEVQRVLDRREREQRDGQHPTEGED